MQHNNNNNNNNKTLFFQRIIKSNTNLNKKNIQW